MRPLALFSAAVVCLAAGPGCKCSDHADTTVTYRLVFPFMTLPAISENPTGTGDDELCAAHSDPDTAIDPFAPASSAPLLQPPTPMQGLGCLTVEVIDSGGNTTGWCRITSEPEVPTDGHLLSEPDRRDDLPRERHLSIARPGDDLPVSIRVRFYDRAGGSLLYTGRSVPFRIFNWDDASAMDQNVTVAMSAQERPYCEPFRCESGAICTDGNGAAVPCPCTTSDGSVGPFLTSDATTMHEPRAFHAALALGDGRVLITGGVRVVGHAGNDGVIDAPSELSDTAEIFDAHTGLFRLLGARLTAPRAGHTMVRLDANTVLLYGGFSDPGLGYFPNPCGGGSASCSPDGHPLRLDPLGLATGSPPGAELFDLTTETFTPLDDATRILRARYAGGDVNGDANGGLVVVGGIGMRDECRDALNDYCDVGAVPNENDEGAIPGTDERIGAAAAVVAESGTPALAVLGGNLAGTDQLLEFRDMGGARTVSVDPALATALDGALLAGTGFSDGSLTLVDSTLSLIDDGSGEARMLLFGGEVLDRGGEALAAEGACNFDVCSGMVACPTEVCLNPACTNWDLDQLAVAMQTEAMTGTPGLIEACGASLPWGSCSTTITPNAGRTRTRPLALVMTWSNIGGLPTLDTVFDLSAMPIAATEPSPQMIPPPGAVYHAATTLPDGRVLLSGGVGGSVLDPTRMMLLYEPGATPGDPGQFVLPTEWDCASHWNAFDCRDTDPIRCMFTPRVGHSATAIADDPGGDFDGMVLIAGGLNKRGPGSVPYLATPWVEFYDERTAAESAATACPPAPDATTFPNGVNTCRIATVPEDEL